MKAESPRFEKRPRIKSKQKKEVLFSTDRVDTSELSAIFTSNVVKKKDPFAR
jgi:hypothetical protein